VKEPVSEAFEVEPGEDRGSVPSCWPCFFRVAYFILLERNKTSNKTSEMHSQSTKE